MLWASPCRQSPAGVLCFVARYSLGPSSPPDLRVCFACAAAPLRSALANYGLISYLPSAWA
jgi:hypothetical protein